MSYVACILAFGLYFVIKKYLPARLARVKGVDFVPFALLAIGTTTLADTAIGTAIANWIVEPVFGMVGSLLGALFGASVSAPMLAGILFVLMAIAAIFDLIDLQVNGVAKTAVIVLPVLALVAIGPFADAGSGLFDGVSSAGTNAVTALVGQ